MWQSRFCLTPFTICLCDKLFAHSSRDGICQIKYVFYSVVIITEGAYLGWEFIAVFCCFYTGFACIVEGVVGYGQLVIARLLSTVDKSLGWGSYIYLQRGSRLVITVLPLCVSTRGYLPNTTLNAGVGYLLWSHRSLKHRRVERQLINHLPFTI